MCRGAVTPILIVSYYFPPIGGAGVQRSLKFVRYLPALGYAPTVVAGPEETYDRWSPRDATLSEEVPPGTKIARLAGPPPGPTFGSRNRAERWLRRATPFERWWVEGAVDAGRRAGAGAQLVFATMPPYESAVAAARIADALRAPWVADLRDPWALDETAIHPTAVHRLLELRRMRAALASASAIVVNTHEAEREIRRRLPELARKPVIAIPNGFDMDDFAGPAPRSDERAFRIAHTGYLHTDLGETRRRARTHRLLGGAAEADVLTRSHVHLVEAVERLVRADPRVASSLELHFAGVLSDADRRAMRVLRDHRCVVREHGYLTHADAVALMRSADLLFLPIHDVPPGKRARIVPGKTYEYLASGKPILAAVPDGDARDLLAACEGVFLCRPTDFAAMAEIVRARLDAFVAGERAAFGRSTVLEAYERRRLTHDLVGVFDAVLGACAASPHRLSAQRAAPLEA
jgi:glycosyltransferase involved in cell wall biosynthesis